MKTPAISTLALLLLLLLAAIPDSATAQPARKSAEDAILERAFAASYGPRPAPISALPRAFALRPTSFRAEGLTSAGNVPVLGRSLRLKQIVGLAYGFPETRIVFPTNMPGERFDFINTASGASVVRLQTELGKRFGIVTRLETRMTNVYLLQMKDSKVFQASRRAGDPCGQIDTLCGGSEFCLETPVVNATGFANDTLLPKQPLPNGSGDQAVDLERHNSRMNAVGLKLTSAVQPVQMLIVEIKR